MCAVIALVFVLLSGLIGVQLVEHPISIPSPTPVVTACATPNPGVDLNNATAIGSSVFTPPLWTYQIMNNPYLQHVTINWFEGKLGAIAHLDYIGEGCLLTQQDLNSLVTNANYQVLFGGWRSFRETAQCFNNGVWLTEFDAESAYKVDYHALYWVERVSPAYIAGLNLVFPATERSEQDDYARQLFPKLNTCTAISSSKETNSQLEPESSQMEAER